MSPQDIGNNAYILSVVLQIQIKMLNIEQSPDLFVHIEGSKAAPPQILAVIEATIKNLRGVKMGYWQPFRHKAREPVLAV